MAHVEVVQHQAASSQEQAQPAGDPEEDSPAVEQFTGDAAMSREAEASQQPRQVGGALPGQSADGTASGEQDAHLSLLSKPTGHPEQVSVGSLDEAAPAASKEEQWWEEMAQGAAGCGVQDAGVARKLSLARSDSGDACEAACRWEAMASL